MDWQKTSLLTASLLLLALPANPCSGQRSYYQWPGRTFQSAGQPPGSIGNSTRYTSRFPRLIAEFEPQRAIMLSVSDLKTQHRHVLRQIVSKSAGHANILILFNDNRQLRNTVELLNDVPHDHVSFCRLQLDTVWLRDFGPRICQERSGFRSLDFNYYGVRPLDDSLPERWSWLSASKLTKIPWTLQGGNLITNGQGLGITTSKIFSENRVVFPNNQASPRQSEQFVLDEFKRYCNLKQLVVLEPLQNETTQHVDMFATMISANHALVASLDSGNDRTNSMILDHNARKLASIKIDGRAMKVSRVPIPVRDRNAWSTYTNSIITDRLVLIPTMDSDGSDFVERAISTYRRLLPKHHVDTIDISSMKRLQGSLHCMSLNLPRFAPLPPGVIEFANAEKIVDQLPPSEVQASKKSVVSVEQQLRRVFRSSSSEDLIDAYAIGMRGDAVVLVRADNFKTVRMPVNGVCKADQYWLRRNQHLIRNNGTQIYHWLMSRK